ncbi:MAG: hypothetical protein ACI9MC_000935 [Kiritimatiellia bacterium]
MRHHLIALALLSACSSGEPFADRVVSFTPGPSAGFGQQWMPTVVLGPPQGAGDASGSFDVLSLGQGGSIVLEFIDYIVVDEPGPDFIVFENTFVGWREYGEVEVSADGQTWHSFGCAHSGEDRTGCAGHNPVYSHPDNDIDPTDPSISGGDPFDLAELGVDVARFVRITDAEVNSYEGVSGGFDLDALAIVNGDVE